MNTRAESADGGPATFLCAHRCRFPFDDGQVPLWQLQALAGRRVELERLKVFALRDEPLVMHIQGIPGVGKTHLLNALAASTGGKGVFVVRVDAHWCEPCLSRALRKRLRSKFPSLWRHKPLRRHEHRS